MRAGVGDGSLGELGEGQGGKVKRKVRQRKKKGETKAKIGAGRRKTTRTHVLPVHLHDLLV